MLQLTKRTEYGLIALVHMANQAAATPEGVEAEVVSARAIGDLFPVPRRLLAQALKALQQGGILESTRGAQGGYRLARGAAEISLGEIVTALEGAPVLTGCASLPVPNAPDASSDGGCDVEPVCPIRSPLSRLRAGIWTLFEGISLQALADRSIDPAQLFSTTPVSAAS